MKKTKQILAILGIILLAALYLTTLFCAIFDSSGTMTVFKASVAATIIIPTLLWIYSFIYKLIRKTSDEKRQEYEEQKGRSLKDKASLNTRK